MQDKLILAGVDELTLVLGMYPSNLESIEEWTGIAEGMIAEFAQRADLENIFGKQMKLESKCPQGYSVGYQYGCNLFYFAIAYHPEHPKIGVIVKYSASSWARYCEKGTTNIKRFLHAVSSPSYRLHLSRVDFNIDFQNWDISVDDIYQRLVENHLEIRDFKGRKNKSQLNGHELNGVASTFYVGSKKTGTRMFLRVYDKKAEQIAKQGIHFREAIYLKSWVRFEVVFKAEYARQLTRMIMETGENHLKDLIINKVAEKYRFFDIENNRYTDFTAALLEKTDKDFQQLRAENTRDNDFIHSLFYLVNGSGLFSALYKCDKVWGDGASKDLLEHLHNIYTKEYKPNDEVLLWLKKHKDTLKSQPLEEEFKLLEELRCKEAIEALWNSESITEILS